MRVTMQKQFENLVVELRKATTKSITLDRPSLRTSEAVFQVGDMHAEETDDVRNKIKRAFEYAHGKNSEGHLELSVRPTKNLFELQAIGKSPEGIELVEFLHGRLK